VVGSARAAVFHVKQRALEAVRAEAAGLAVTPAEAAKVDIRVNEDGQRRSLMQLLSYPGVGWTEVARLWPQVGAWAPAVREQIEVDAAYAGYLDRQQAEVDAFRRDEALALPAELDYAAVPGLSNECRQKLAAVQPQTLGQASRIEGVTPGAITALLAHVRRKAA
jgi:tRNA uridine 5-carboxymethylaminomethyl modification enzyme